MPYWLRKTNSGMSDKNPQFKGWGISTLPIWTYTSLSLFRQALQELITFWLALWRGLKENKLHCFCMKLNQRMCSRTVSIACECSLHKISHGLKENTHSVDSASSSPTVSLYTSVSIALTNQDIASGFSRSSSNKSSADLKLCLLALTFLETVKAEWSQ